MLIKTSGQPSTIADKHAYPYPEQLSLPPVDAYPQIEPQQCPCRPSLFSISFHQPAAEEEEPSADHDTEAFPNTQSTESSSDQFPGRSLVRLRTPVRDHQNTTRCQTKAAKVRSLAHDCSENALYRWFLAPESESPYHGIDSIAICSGTRQTSTPDKSDSTRGKETNNTANLEGRQAERYQVVRDTCQQSDHAGAGKERMDSDVEERGEEFHGSKSI